MGLLIPLHFVTLRIDLFYKWQRLFGILLMATNIEEALNTLKGAENNQVELDHLEDGSIMIRITPQKKTEGKAKEGKWAQFAEKMHEESPLKGRSEKLKSLIRDFKNDFSFENE